MNSFQIGAMAEKIALAYERVRLGENASRKYLTSVMEKPSLGYDIESVESGENLTPRFIEVKTLNSKREIIISKNQVDILRVLKEKAYLYIVNLKTNSVEAVIQDPIGNNFESRSSVNSYNLKI